MKKRDFPRALVFGFFIGAGAYVGAAAWHVTGLAAPVLVLAAAVGAFWLSLMSSHYPDPVQPEPARAAPQREAPAPGEKTSTPPFSGQDDLWPHDFDPRRSMLNGLFYFRDPD